jgi:hypothetical protein
MKAEKNILPLCVDVLNPSPSIGWENKERDSLFERPKPDAVLALALIHHLAIGANIPLFRLAEFFKILCSFLIIEFVPITDEKVQLLLKNRENIFGNYTEKNFVREFEKYFEIKKQEKIPNSDRIMYLMIKRKEAHEK